MFDATVDRPDSGDSSNESSRDRIELPDIPQQTWVTVTCPESQTGYQLLPMLLHAGAFSSSGSTLTYQWAFVSSPAGSSAGIAGADMALPGFTPDVVGEWRVRFRAVNVEGQLGTCEYPLYVPR